MLVKKPVRTAKTPREFPGQPRELEPIANFQMEVEAVENPQVIVMAHDTDPEHVRVVIARFAVEELYAGSSMLVAGAKISNDGLIEFIRSLMTIANRRGLLCRL